LPLGGGTGPPKAWYSFSKGCEGAGDGTRTSPRGNRTRRGRPSLGHRPFIHAARTRTKMRRDTPANVQLHNGAASNPWTRTSSGGRVRRVSFRRGGRRTRDGPQAVLTPTGARIPSLDPWAGRVACSGHTLEALGQRKEHTSQPASAPGPNLGPALQR